MLMKAGGSAVKDPAAAVSKQVEITNPTAESSLRQRKVRMWGLRFELMFGLIADLAIFICSSSGRMGVAAIFNYSDLGDLRGFPGKEHRIVSTGTRTKMRYD